MKKILRLIVVLILICSFILTASYAENASGNAVTTDMDKYGIVTIDEARGIALGHILSDMTAKNDQSFNPGKFGKETVLFDMDENPSAYLFELENEEGEPNGYVIVGANRFYVPIIEFAYQGTPSILNALAKARKDAVENEELNKSKNEVKLYYLQGLDYFASIEDDNGKTITYDITRGLKKLDKKELKKQFSTKIKDEKYKAMWDELAGDNSNPPSSSSDYPLTNPDNYESGYASKSVKNVTAYDRAYNVTDDFKTINGTTYSNHCGPTTGTNVLKYWFGRDTTKYSKLYDNNLWKSAFVELYGSMKTGTNGTTYLSDYTSAIKKYFTDRGLSCSTSYSTSNNFNSFKNEIDADRPVTLLTQGHVLYGDHYVLALGYIQYKYGGIIPTYSEYFRIADAWSSRPDRFIHYTSGVNHVYRSSTQPS
jgi:hypothetical protein